MKGIDNKTNRRDSSCAESDDKLNEKIYHSVWRQSYSHDSLSFACALLPINELKATELYHLSFYRPSLNVYACVCACGTLAIFACSKLSQATIPYFALFYEEYGICYDSLLADESISVGFDGLSF